MEGALGLLPVQILEERAHADVHGGRPPAPGPAGPHADAGSYRAPPVLAKGSGARVPPAGGSGQSGPDPHIRQARRQGMIVYGTFTTVTITRLARCGSLRISVRK